MKSFVDLVSDLAKSTWPSNWWKRTEFSESISTALQVASGITAGAGGGQGNAVEIGAGISVIETVATLGDSVYPSNDMPIGYPFVILNAGANSVSCFPPSGGKINNGEASEWNIPAGSTAIGYKVADNEFTLSNATEI